MLAYLLQGFALGFPAAATPGPLQAFLLNHTLQHGWRRTLPAVFAPLLSDIIIISLILLLLNQAPDEYLRVVRILGGLFILYLAKGAFDSFRYVEGFDSSVVGTGRKSLLKAALINLLNPNPYLFWTIVAGPILLSGWRESASRGIGFLVGFYGAFVGSMALAIAVYATSRHLGSRIIRALNGLSALALLLFGLLQLWIGLTG